MPNLKIDVQVNGESYSQVEVPAEAGHTTIEAIAREKIEKTLDGQRVVKTIVVPGKLVNFVAMTKQVDEPKTFNEILVDIYEQLGVPKFIPSELRPGAQVEFPLDLFKDEEL